MYNPNVMLLVTLAWLVAYFQKGTQCCIISSSVLGGLHSLDTWTPDNEILIDHSVSSSYWAFISDLRRKNWCSFRSNWRGFLGVPRMGSKMNTS